MASNFDNKKGRSLDHIIAKLSKERSFRKRNRILLVSESNNACVSLSSDEDSDERRPPDLHQCGNCKLMFSSLTRFLTHRLEKVCFNDFNAAPTTWALEENEDTRRTTQVAAICDNSPDQDQEAEAFSPSLDKRRHERKGLTRKLDKGDSPIVENELGEDKDKSIERIEITSVYGTTNNHFRPHSADDVTVVPSRTNNDTIISTNDINQSQYRSASYNNDVRRRSSDFIVPLQRIDDTQSREDQRRRLDESPQFLQQRSYNNQIHGVRPGGTHAYFNGTFPARPMQQPQFRNGPQMGFQDNAYFTRPPIGYQMSNQNQPPDNWTPVSMQGRRITTTAESTYQDRRGPPPEHITTDESRRRTLSASSAIRQYPQVINDTTLSSPPSKPPELVKVSEVYTLKPPGNEDAITSPIENEELISIEGDGSRDSETPSASMTISDERYVRSVSPIRSSSPIDVLPRTSSAPSSFSLAKITVPSSGSKRTYSETEETNGRNGLQPNYQAEDYTGRRVDRVFAPTSPGNDPSWRHSKQAYRCPLCAKVFPFKSKLQRHVLVHTGIKPYKCHVCGRGFTQQIDLQRHLTRHTGEKPFKCHLCKAQFIRADNLRKHAKDTHYISIEEPTRKRRRKTVGSDTVLPPLEVAIALAISETEKNGGRVLGRKTGKFNRGSNRQQQPVNNQLTQYPITPSRLDRGLPLIPEQKGHPSGFNEFSQGSQNGHPPNVGYAQPPPPPPMGQGQMSNAFWRDGQNLNFIRSPSMTNRGMVEHGFPPGSRGAPMQYESSIRHRDDSMKYEHEVFRTNENTDPPSMLSVHDIHRRPSGAIAIEQDNGHNM